MSLRELKDIEYSGKSGDPLYFVFSKHVVDHTESYANGEVNVDVDPKDEVVGIELLSDSPENIALFLEIVKKRQLSLKDWSLVPRRG